MYLAVPKLISRYLANKDKADTLTHCCGWQIIDEIIMTEFKVVPKFQLKEIIPDYLDTWITDAELCNSMVLLDQHCVACGSVVIGFESPTRITPAIEDGSAPKSELDIRKDKVPIGPIENALVCLRSLQD